MKNRKGFTIVELVIVIAVIAILAAVLIPTFSGVVQKANESAALQEATSTMKATLAMSKTAVIADGTRFAIGDAKKTNYMYEYTKNAISETSDIKVLKPYDGGATVPADDANVYYDRIIINDSLITNDLFNADATKVQGVLISSLEGAKKVEIQKVGTTKNGTDPVMNDPNASFELVVYSDAAGTTVLNVLAVYTSSDYAKDVVTFVPATKAAS
jgi:prepilin-type N-terminal cleavage/methylation domain-containing protein